ncbi:MAG: hypothetical protein ACOC5L_01640 [Halobacteriota archaeon]
MVGKEVSYFSIVNFLLSDEVKLLAELAPGMLRRLSHSNQRDPKISKDCVLVVKERLPRFNQTIFECRPPPGIYNLPENQLLKFILRKIQILIEEIINDSSAKGMDRFEEVIASKKGLDERLAWLKYRVSDALKNIYLSQVDLPSQVTERMLINAIQSRNKDYALVEECYDLYRRLILGNDKEELKSIIEESIALYRVSEV